MGYKQFWAELRQRFLTDNSESLHGEVDIFIPDLKHREAEKELAVLEAYKMLSDASLSARGINQIIIYTRKGGRFVVRVEANQFHDEKCDRVEVTPTMLKVAEFVKEKSVKVNSKGFCRKPKDIPPNQIKLRDFAIPA